MSTLHLLYLLSQKMSQIYRIWVQRNILLSQKMSQIQAADNIFT